MQPPDCFNCRCTDVRYPQSVELVGGPRCGDVFSIEAGRSTLVIPVFRPADVLAREVDLPGAPVPVIGLRYVRREGRVFVFDGEQEF